MKHQMITTVNARATPWPEVIWQKWESCRPMNDNGTPAPVTYSNYFTPRPYMNEYDRGSKEEGFVYILHGSVWVVVINEHEEWDINDMVSKHILTPTLEQTLKDEDEDEDERLTDN